MAKYNTEIVKKICKSLENGSSYLDAAISAGIAESTFYRWKKEKNQFYKDIKKAESKCVDNDLKAITKAINQGTWQAAAWRLERKRPNEFGRNVAENKKDDKKKEIISDVEAKQIIQKLFNVK